MNKSKKVFSISGGDGLTRLRCSGCGNLTRFDVTSVRRAREYWHYNVAGDRRVEDRDVVEETIESVVCRWCGASGDAVERVALQDDVT